MRKIIKYLATGLAFAASGGNVYMDKCAAPSLDFKGSKKDLKRVFGTPKRVEHTFTVRGVEISAVDKKTARKIYERRSKNGLL